ncbi:MULTISPECIES: phosphopantetheine-binding protein [Asaia]|uniref:phosphopantetheine-binding protein n=1 Tax=Asaia TaxID=91914 RepID=UPI0038D14283
MTCSIDHIVISILTDHFDTKIDSITSETRFTEDLSADSFDIVELLFEIEEKAGIAIRETTFPTIVTVGDLIELLRHGFETANIDLPQLLMSGHTSVSSRD